MQALRPLLLSPAVYWEAACCQSQAVLCASLQNINAGIEATAFVPGSLQLVEDPEQQFAIRIDSANTPDQLSRLLDAVRDSGARRIILVTGCPGSHDLRDRDLRPRIGEMAHYKVGLGGAQQ